MTMTSFPSGEPISGAADVTGSVLAPAIERWTRGRQDWLAPVPDVLLFRREHSAPPAVCLLEPSIVIVVQGTKRMFAGGLGHTADLRRFVVTSVNVPGLSEVIEASPAHPCLGVAMRLDLRVMAELIAQNAVQPKTSRTQDASVASVASGALTQKIVDSFHRLLGLLDEPEAIPVLAPLIQREILFRLLMTEQASHLWHAAVAGSQGHRIVQTIDWLKLNYAEPLRIDDLARRAQMSLTTFHHHFRQLTAMSPLQYQKWLRLNEARRLMLNDDFDAATAAFHVGYESPPQFSREYCRLFGLPPKRDVEQLRAGRPELPELR